MCEEESPQRLSFNKQRMLCLPLRHEKLAAVLLVILLPLYPGDAFGNRPPLLLLLLPVHSARPILRKLGIGAEKASRCQGWGGVGRGKGKLRWSQAADIIQAGVNGILKKACSTGDDLVGIVFASELCMAHTLAFPVALSERNI